jgi:hypothetical protein
MVQIFLCPPESFYGGEGKEWGGILTSICIEQNGGGEHYKTKQDLSGVIQKYTVNRRQKVDKRQHVVDSGQ